MIDQQLKGCNKTLKNHDNKKASPSSKKQNRKGENPLRYTPATDHSSTLEHSKSWICKNSACRAVISIDDSFCRRCSCCICHKFDDNKDPSLWLVCESEGSKDDSCGLTCHIECAFQLGKVGVVNVGQFMQLDGSYCCASCGKVSGVLGCWRKQLVVAKDARRVDALCYRIFLSNMLLHGTSRFKELHEIVKEAKSKLESDLGPIDGVSDKMGRGIVSRLSVASDVQKLCADAIEKADEWLANASNGEPISRVDSLPAACRFVFEEVTSSSIVIVLIEIPTHLTDNVKDYKLWYSKSRQEMFSTEPICSIPREKRRILISNLQPCTEYTFRIVSYTESGSLGHSQASCYTKSADVIQKRPNPCGILSAKKENIALEENSPGKKTSKKPNGYSSGFKVRDLGKILHLAGPQQKACHEGFCSETRIEYQVVEDKQSPPTARVLDLNVVSVPDLNEDLIPPFESSRDEDNGCSLDRAIGADDDAASHGTLKNGQPNKVSLKRSVSPNDTLDCNSTLISGSPFRNPGGLDENFEDCVKIIRWLEIGGHINQEFRLKLLTWFSLRSTEQERRVVNTFIQALVDDPKSLAGQLVDSFSDIVSSKRPRNSFNGKPQH
ncbi:hypothetical protein V2J09_018800 [Rumex salicifolius]